MDWMKKSPGRFDCRGWFLTQGRRAAQKTYWFQQLVHLHLHILSGRLIVPIHSCMIQSRILNKSALQIRERQILALQRHQTVMGASS